MANAQRGVYLTERDRDRSQHGPGDAVYLVRAKRANKEDTGTRLLRMQHVSPWSDVPLRPYKASAPMLNMVCEVPRGTRAKYE